MTSSNPHQTSRNLLQKISTPPSPKSHIYCPSPLLLWSSCSELSEMLSPGYGSRFTLICNPHAVLFFFSSWHMIEINFCSWKYTYYSEIQIQPWLLYNYPSGSYLSVSKGEIWSKLIKFVFLLSFTYVKRYSQNTFIVFLRKTFFFTYTYKLKVL